MHVTRAFTSITAFTQWINHFRYCGLVLAADGAFSCFASKPSETAFRFSRSSLAADPKGVGCPHSRLMFFKIHEAHTAGS